MDATPLQHSATYTVELLHSSPLPVDAEEDVGHGSLLLTLVIIIIVFIVSRAPDLVLLVKKLLDVGRWFSDVWCKNVEVGVVL